MSQSLPHTYYRIHTTTPTPRALLTTTYSLQRSPSVQNSSSSSSQRWKEATTGKGTGEACNRRAVRKQKASLVELCFVRTACRTRQLLFFSSDLTPALPLSSSLHAPHPPSFAAFTSAPWPRLMRAYCVARLVVLLATHTA